MARILEIGDPHNPCTKKGYLQFCKDTAEEYECDTIVSLGDIVDWHGISFHAGNTAAPGVTDEYELAYEGIQEWHEAFPEMTVCIGNHDERIIRLAESVSIPSKFIRDYKDIWDTPKWDWVYDKIIDDVYHFHGTGHGGMHPAYNVARQMGMSVVMGHIHSTAGIKWLVSPNKRWFGMDTGCGVDDEAYAFAYGKHMKKKSVLGCGVVLDGIPYYEIMPIEKYK